MFTLRCRSKGYTVAEQEAQCERDSIRTGVISVRKVQCQFVQQTEHALAHGVRQLIGSQNVTVGVGMWQFTVTC